MSAVSNTLMMTIATSLLTFVLPQEMFTSKIAPWENEGDVSFDKDDQFHCTEYRMQVNKSYIVQYNPLNDVNMAHHVLVFGCCEQYNTEGDGTWNCRKICRSTEPIRFAWSSITLSQGDGGVVDAVSGDEYIPTYGVEEGEELTLVRELLVYGTDTHLQIQAEEDSSQPDVTINSDESDTEQYDTDTEKDNTKSSMKEYWNEHSKDASMEEMMLDNDAEELSKDELPEILSYLPTYDYLDIVELGAGIGRFTTHLAKRARKVLAVDFMENFIEKNREINKNFTNIDYLAEDVMAMKLKANEWDLVFSNWLYMYLDNDELTYFLQNSLTWLRTDGYMFCRESCLQQSGSKLRTINPTYYRDPLVYDSLLASVTIPTEDGQAFYGFERVFSKSVDTYVKMKNNDNQLVWLVQKVRRLYNTSKDFVPLPELREQRHLEMSRTLRREELVGKGFIKTGGIEIAKMAADMLNLQEGQRVLDLSCGIGGFSIYIAKTYGVEVVASDGSSTAIHIARERAKEAGVQQVKFEVASTERRIHAPESFDVIYSRDVLADVKDKVSLLQRLYDALKAGGRVLMADFCIDDDVEDIELDTDVFIEDLDHNSNVPSKITLQVLSTGGMIDIMKEVGFVKVSAIDRTDAILRALENELFLVKEQSNAECLDTLTIRRQILNKLKSGNSWMMIYAEKQTK
ncbi:phosphoethanolamine N-methyltransferase 3-like isoform X2 [Pecten maximus]|uniref:phosphoethanolamine N-methyltransferase 3-like isoform X2 n=1 Tax=Pecten maximus TaxID=6579 RepID=UPI0014583FD1|nr:phosphoethanolamine N-methyltransferase 3-like isoform X2 [Pecten maximus]